MRSLIDQWDVEEWWDYPCSHAMVHLVECCHPGSTLLIQPMVCCPVEEECCDYSNASVPTSSESPTPIQQHNPTSQLIVRECSQKIGVPTLVISILGMASAVAVLLIFALARHIFLDSIYS
jgi:hypothetical protein